MVSVDGDLQVTIICLITLLFREVTSTWPKPLSRYFVLAYQYLMCNDLFFLFQEQEFTHLRNGYVFIVTLAQRQQFGAWAFYFTTWSVATFPLKQMNKFVMPISPIEHGCLLIVGIWSVAASRLTHLLESHLKRFSVILGWSQPPLARPSAPLQARATDPHPKGHSLMQGPLCWVGIWETWYH